MISKKHPWVVTPDNQTGRHGSCWSPQPVAGCIWIPLRNRLGQIVAYTLIEEQDANLANMTWHLRRGGYAARGITHRHHHQGPTRKKIELLHRVILRAPQGLEVDHINRNRLDNAGATSVSPPSQSKPETSLSTPRIRPVTKGFPSCETHGVGNPALSSMA